MTLEQASPDAAFAGAIELLRRAADSTIKVPRAITFYRPTPTLAVSRWESRQPGFTSAESSARALGFRTAVRPTGGRAVAYDESCVVFDLVVAETGSLDPRWFFEETSARIAATLREFGVDARVGPVEGEYCPGEFSVNARGAVKLVGTSQRAVRGARLLSGMLPLGSVDPLVPVVDCANKALGLTWNPATFGSLATEVPSIERADLVAALGRALL